MPTNKGYTPPSKAEVLAMRQQKTGVPYELQEASSREASFLRKLSGAKDDYDWIVANQAWTKLGFENFTEWYTKRVWPVMQALGARPMLEIAADVVERVRDDDEHVPQNQRHTQNDLAQLSGLPRNSNLIRPRSAPATNVTGTDLEDTPDARPTPSAAGSAADHVDQRPGPESPAGRSPSTSQPGPDTSVERSAPEVVPDVPPQPEGEAGGGEPEEGASTPSSGTKAERSEALANWAKDNSEGAAAERRSRLYKWLSNQHAMVAGYDPESIEDLLDGDLVEAIGRFGDQVADWVAGVEQAYGKTSKLRLVKGA